MTACPRCREPKHDPDMLCRDCMVALRILHALEDRRGLPLSRAALEQLTGLPDRTNRRIIVEKLRRFGEAVCAETTEGHAGYHTAQTEGDRDALESVYFGRAMEELKTLNALRRKRAEKSGKQAVLAEVAWVSEAGQGVLAV